MERWPGQLANSSVRPQHVRDMRPRMSDTADSPRQGERLIHARVHDSESFTRAVSGRHRDRSSFSTQESAARLPSQTPWTTGKQVDEASFRGQKAKRANRRRWSSMGNLAERPFHVLCGVCDGMGYGQRSSHMYSEGRVQLPR